MTPNNQSNIDEQMRSLALEYVRLHKSGDTLGAEIILHDIQKLKELTDAKNSNKS